jgi:putative hydrolase of the HAD superfamily
MRHQKPYPLIIFFDLDGTLLNHALAECLGAKEFLLRHRNLFKFTEQEFVQIWQEIAEKHMLRYLSNEISFTQQRRARMHELFSYAHCQLSDSEADTQFEFYLQQYRLCIVAEKKWSLRTLSQFRGLG